MARHEGELVSPVPCSSSGHGLPVETPNSVDLRQAQGAAGELLWAAVRTRPDIAYAVSRLASVMSQSPKAIKMGDTLFQYLRKTPDMGLIFSRDGNSFWDQKRVVPQSQDPLLEAYASGYFGFWVWGLGYLGFRVFRV